MVKYIEAAIWWLLDGVATGVAGVVLVPLVVGGFAWLQKRASKLAPILLSALIALASSLTILVSARVIVAERDASEVTTVENIDRLVREWADRAGWSIQRRDSEGELFTFRITLSTGRVLRVSRIKDRPENLTITSGVDVDDDQQVCTVSS